MTHTYNIGTFACANMEYLIVVSHVLGTSVSQYKNLNIITVICVKEFSNLTQLLYLSPLPMHYIPSVTLLYSIHLYNEGPALTLHHPNV